MDAHIMQQRRMLRAELDAMPDGAVDGAALAFAQRFATVAADEPFFTAPDAFVASCRSLLDADVVDTVPRTVHDTICVRIGCNRVPLFALVSGGRDRTLYSSGVSTPGARRSLTSGASSAPTRSSGR